MFCEIKVGMTLKDLEKSFDEAKKELVLKTLKHTNQNRSEAARILGVTYHGLNNYRKKIGIPSLLSDEDLAFIKEQTKEGIASWERVRAYGN